MDQPWINFDNYTIAEVTCFLIGVVLWAYAYIQAVINNHRKKTLEIPIPAVCLNYGWEIGCVFFFTNGIDMGKLFVIGYAVWMLIDTIIVYQMFKYGTVQIESNYIKKHIKLLLVVCLIGSIAAHSFFYIEGFELPMAVISAYIINLAMSIAYCGLVFKNNFNGLSKSIGWAKGFGTGIISVCFFMKYPDKNFLTTMYIMTFLFDMIYMYLLYYIKPQLDNKNISNN